MFRNGINLKKNSWHAKFLNYIYDTDFESFKNFCPYFWLLIGTIILLPLILLFKGIIYLVRRYRDCYYDLKNPIIIIGRFITEIVKTVILLLFTFFMYLILASTIIMIVESKILLESSFLIFCFILFVIVPLIITLSINYHGYKNFGVDTLGKLTKPMYYFMIPFAIIFNIACFIVCFPFKMLFRLFKKFYDDNCPMIHWK